jgi:large subunit ribosomal protein L13
MKYSIDATNKKLGRLGSEVAILLMGKNTTEFQKNKIPNVEVTVENASKMNISEKKQDEKNYTHYSGYPGGLRVEKIKDVLVKKGYGDILKRTVYGMLPKNKLRSKMIQRLKISE